MAEWDGRNTRGRTKHRRVEEGKVLYFDPKKAALNALRLRRDSLERFTSVDGDEGVLEASTEEIVAGVEG